jgi:hypothetical protein
MSWLSDKRTGGDAGATGLTSGSTAGTAWLEDAFLERYVCWREASEDVRFAYDNWASSERADRDRAFAAYGAALDREESAACDYREIVNQLQARAYQALERR